MLSFAHKPIYDGAAKPKLSIAIRLLGAITSWHTIEKCLDYFIKMLLDVIPIDNCIPKTYDEAKKKLYSRLEGYRD